MVGFLLADIYPKEEWNFVFGLADSDVYTGVFSFARYHESFYYEGPTPNYSGTDDMIEVTFRSSSVLVHEIGHLFDLRHCISFKCAMNGSNSLEETKTKPFLFCPNCLQKLVYKLKTNPLTLLNSFKDALIDIGEGKFVETAKEV
jgi:archaemetzincin